MMPDRESDPALTGCRIAITGATGFVGGALERFLTVAGCSVLRISRSAPRPGSGDIPWDPSHGLLDPARLEGVDGVVHLAGESIAQRWTAGARRRILDSRVAGTTLLARTLAALARPPAVLLSASAVGVYGDRGDQPVDEESPTGEGFLSEVVRAWESATGPAADAGVRVVHARLGVVLGQGGGVLERLLPIFRLGLGGQIGDGRQWMSWVARSDVVRAFDCMLRSPSLAGPVNVVAPAPVTNASFTAALGHVLHRPTLARVPALALRAIYGQMSDETLLSGQRVTPTRLIAAGFHFRYPELEEALRGELDMRERAGG